MVVGKDLFMPRKENGGETLNNSHSKGRLLCVCVYIYMCVCARAHTRERERERERVEVTLKEK